MELIQEMMRQWYLLLSQASATLSLPLRGAADQLQLPVFTVLLLGLVGSLSPCQLTTNLSAMAYVSRRPGPGRWWPEAFAYTMSKVLVYTMIGGAVIFLGLRFEQAAIPVAVAARKIIGPLMVIIGLSFLGLIRVGASLGSQPSERPECHLSQGEVSKAFPLGVLFSFAFCPTFFWLFFGLMIPMALGNAGGWVFPGLFAVGASLPLLVFSGLVGLGRRTFTAWIDRLKDSHRKISRVAGIVFILAGINDTLIYWLL
ncbi:MAG: sulfite exporter TauE/SafE family protein [Candidatus Binatia bacterium]|nr:sulfite exporter TauE/SafE family protein [Candidatus Binatia bacterium]